MLGQARPNSITQVMIYNLGYDLTYISQQQKNSVAKMFVIDLLEIKTLSHYWLINDLGLRSIPQAKTVFFYIYINLFAILIYFTVLLVSFTAYFRLKVKKGFREFECYFFPYKLFFRTKRLVLTITIPFIFN